MELQMIYEKIFDYESSSLENVNMKEIETLINFMATRKTTILWAEQTKEHKEKVNYNEFEAIEQGAQESYAEFCDVLRDEMKSKDKTALSEYLDLIKQVAKDEYEADKTPNYVPAKERKEFSHEQFSAYLNKRALRAKYETICDAQEMLSRINSASAEKQGMEK